MPCQPRPEAEEEPQGGDTARRLRTIERLVSRADGLVELHVQAALGEEPAPEGEPL